MKRESHIFISDDIAHDFHAVNHFLEQSIATLKNMFVISKIVIFSDGCGAQYKSKGPLADLSRQNLHTDHSYFGSEHGKSESDGETGVVNHAIERAIVGRQVIINNAQDMVSWCEENLCQPSVNGFTRRFFLVTVTNRNRPKTDVKTLST